MAGAKEPAGVVIFGIGPFAKGRACEGWQQAVVDRGFPRFGAGAIDFADKLTGETFADQRFTQGTTVACAVPSQGVVYLMCDGACERRIEVAQHVGVFGIEAQHDDAGARGIPCMPKLRNTATWGRLDYDIKAWKRNDGAKTFFGRDQCAIDLRQDGIQRGSCVQVVDRPNHIPTLGGSFWLAQQQKAHRLGNWRDVARKGIEMREGLPMAQAGQTVGLLGGSFDPPHAGHAHLTRQALKRFGLDRVGWLVSPGNPLKTRGPAPLSERMAACRAIMDHPRVDITDFEARVGTRYTAQTIVALRLAYPGVRFVWLMGADNLAQFHRWQHWRWIMQTVPVGVIARPGDRISARTSKAAQTFERARISGRSSHLLARAEAPAWCFVNVPMMDMSSSAIRAEGGWG